jgi:uncharacterized protein YkwD
MKTRLFAVMAAVFVIVLLTLPAQSQSAQQDIRWIHAQLNAWRMGLGLGPLAYNDTLAQMAQDQATFAATWTQIPSNLHAGRNGEGPRVRALYDAYAWPTYGAAQQVVVGEIAWFGRREDAIAFWRTSQIHRETVTNPWYREIGIGAVPRKDSRGYFFYAVLGARPNVLPALADPQNAQLYLTNDTYSRGRGEWMRDATLVRLFDMDGRPLSPTWLPWSATVPLPENAGERVYVLYSDGTHESMAEVDLRPRQIPLPNYEAEWFSVQVNNWGEVQPTSTPAPTLTPSPPPPAHIRLIYDRYALTLVNTSPTNASVVDLELVSADGSQSLPVRTLQTGFVRGSLTSLPRGNCLQAANNLSRVPQLPLCTRSSATYIAQRQLIWLSDFEVRSGSTVLARCDSDTGQCEFDLPST